ncbi:MAG: 3,4-dihydroxy-2-butanone-4-phosphate synthase [Flavobacteriales bacterium]|nr:MAG: 3,4-dihydroxy-2-butanone-4-phosphate synthase [Flavobacteriales bacterium TMED96]RZP11270.1 MAG: 3,4-dihydroxy-2-butanone-4-phosphate synthase [Flavobacteriales bacterium]|tara:strand:+ start:1835 stop:2968 length:1134 start_codon:yes stop_codon:yes gene_type:complete
MSKKEKIKLDNIEDAIESIRKGEVIIVVDDENRENEGDFLAAAEKITPSIINFMAKEGRGLICVPLSEKRCKEIKLDRMVSNSADPMGTAFTISVDLKGKGVTTGISAKDRALTIKALVNENTKSNDFSKPGHIFPLIGKEGGVLRRTGHTEAAIDFARLAGMKPAGVIVEIMNEDGSMARLPELYKVSKKFGLKIVSIEDLVAYRMEHDSLILKREDTFLNTRFGEYRLRAYQQTTNDQVHLALTKGNMSKNESTLVRINSSQTRNDLLSLLMGSNEEEIDKVFSLINKEGKGAVIFINQPAKSSILLARLKKMKKSKSKNDQIPRLKMDSRDFGIGAQILHDLSIRKLRVITNSKQKPRIGITGYGLEIVDYVKF